jgi:hypothetical protein
MRSPVSAVRFAWSSRRARGRATRGRMRAVVLDALDALVDGVGAPRGTRRPRAASAAPDVRDALEELRVHVVRERCTCAEERDGLVVGAVAVLAATHQVEQLVVEVAVLVVVELLERLGRRSGPRGDDVPRARAAATRAARATGASGVEVEVALAALDDLVEDRERRLVEAQVVEALAQVELRLLLVGRSVLRLAADHALELHRGLLVALLLVEPQRVGERLARRTLRSGTSVEESKRESLATAKVKTQAKSNVYACLGSDDKDRVPGLSIETFGKGDRG